MANANTSNGANLGFENKRWEAADNLRGKMDAAEYKHVVLGLIFLKYISDAFMEHYQQLEQLTSDPGSEYFIHEEQARYTVFEDRDEYVAENVFWVPKEALQANPSGELHEELGLISFDQARSQYVLREFHVEGFVNQYLLEGDAGDESKIRFVTESIKNMPPGLARENH